MHVVVVVVVIIIISTAITVLSLMIVGVIDIEHYLDLCDHGVHIIQNKPTIVNDVVQRER